MRHVHIAKLHEAAKTRKTGYLETALKAGKTDGEWVIFDDATYEALRREFNPLAPSRVTVPGAALRPGLGDAIHKVAGPIGRAINWPCLKGDGTTDLRPGSPCDRARKMLNQVKL